LPALRLPMTQKLFRSSFLALRNLASPPIEVADAAWPRGRLS